MKSFNINNFSPEDIQEMRENIIAGYMAISEARKAIKQSNKNKRRVNDSRDNQQKRRSCRHSEL